MSIFNKFPYIVIEGPIGCGKTTLAKMLADQFPVDYLSEKAQAERNSRCTAANKFKSRGGMWLNETPH